MYRVGQSENVLDRPETKKQQPVQTKQRQQDNRSIWRTIQDKLDEIQKAALEK